MEKVFISSDHYKNFNEGFRRDVIYGNITNPKKVCFLSLEFSLWKNHRKDQMKTSPPRIVRIKE